MGYYFRLIKDLLIVKKGLGHQELCRKVNNLVLYELFLPKILPFPFWKRHFNFPN